MGQNSAGRYLDLTFGDDGSLGFVYADELLPIVKDVVVPGTLEITRASDVEFEDGAWVPRIRAWVPGGAVCLGGFDTRAKAVAAEVQYLERALA